MVQFGKKLAKIALMRPEWTARYFDYKALKTCIKRFRLEPEAALDAENEFCSKLDYEMEKVSRAFTAELSRIEQALADLDDICEGSDDDMLRSRVEIGYEIVHLLKFANTNAIAIRKILKKHDKNCREFGSDRLMQSYLYSRMEAPDSKLRRLVSQGHLGQIVAKLRKHLLTQGTLQGVALADELTEALRSVRETSSLLEFIAGQSLIGGLEDIGGEAREDASDSISEFINLFSTFAYLCNYYVIVPSANSYMSALYAPVWLGGVLMALAPLSALLSTIFFSYWANTTFKRPMLLGAFLCLIGNTLYAMSLDTKSIWLVCIGRVFVGLGGQRCINRRFIADTVGTSRRTKASIAFVIASAAGQSVGPGLASILYFVNFKVGGWTVNFLTSPGWSMALVWLLFLVVTTIFFQDVSPKHRLYGQKLASRKSRRSVHEEENGNSEALVPLLEDVGSSEPSAVTSAAVSLQPVATCLLVYVMLKLCQELLTNSTPLVARIYFGWSPASSGIYLAILAIVLVPISMLFGLISASFSDRTMVLFSQVAIAIGGLILTDLGTFFRFSLTQYIFGSVCVFIFSQVLEGFNMALLSKVVSPKLASGTFNSGFLATEAGTFARACGDVWIGVAATRIDYLENMLFVPMTVVVLLSISFTLFTYRSLQTHV